MRTVFTGFGAAFSLEELTAGFFSLDELETGAGSLDELDFFVLEELTLACFALDETAVEELEIATELDDAAELTADELIATELELGSVFATVAAGVSSKRSLPFSSVILLNCFLAILTIVNLF